MCGALSLSATGGKSARLEKAILTASPAVRRLHGIDGPVKFD